MGRAALAGGQNGSRVPPPHPRRWRRPRRQHRGGTSGLGPPPGAGPGVPMGKALVPMGTPPAPGSAGRPSGGCGAVRGAAGRDVARRAGTWRGGPGRGAVADELTSAAARGDPQRLRELLDGAADPNAANSYGRTPTQVMMLGSPRVAKLLLRQGGPQPPRPAHRLPPGFLEAPTTLHRAGARLDLPDGRGRLPLDVAAGGPHGAVGRYLRDPLPCA